MTDHTYIHHKIWLMLSLTLGLVLFGFAGWRVGARASSQSARERLTQPAEQTGKGPSLTGVLNANGTVKAGLAGSFDASGYRMEYTATGAPRFLPMMQEPNDRWDGQFGLPGTNGEIIALAIIGNDLYVGGEFTRAGDSIASYLAKWDGTHWSALGAGVNGPVFALAVSGGDLYVSGGFTFAGNNPANHIAKWDGVDWLPLGSGINNGGVALAVSGSNLFVGGSFSTAGGIPVNNIAKWDGSSWSALGSGVDDFVGALAMNGTELFVGGLFTSAGGIPAQRIAKWNGNSWSVLGTGVDGFVGALAVNGNDLYAGGSFTSAGSTPANHIAKWNGSSWSALGAGVDNTVNDLVFSGNNLFVGGRFTTVGNISARGIAKWDGSSWTALGDGVNGTVSVLATSNASVYAGVDFNTANNGPADYVMQWNGNRWSSLGAGNGLTGLFVSALANSGSDLYVGGYFSAAGVNRAFNVAKWDGHIWSVLGNGLNSGVYALAVNGNDLYARGEFTMAGGNPAYHVAKWDGSNWSPLGNGLSVGTGALIVIGNDLYASDRYLVDNRLVYRIVKWSGNDWIPFGGDIDGVVLCATASGSDLYIGGQFTSISGIPANNIAKWNGGSWSVLGSGVNDIVRVIAVSGNDLYVGGSFTQAGGASANCIAKWDGSNWSALGSGLVASANPSVNVSALAVNGNDLYVGGSFNIAGGQLTGNIAKWDGSTWSSLGGGLFGNRLFQPVTSLNVIGSSLYIGGSFTQAAGKPSYYFGRYFIPSTLNLTPTEGLTRMQGTAATNVQIATATTPITTSNSLTVTVNGAASTTVNGVTLSNLSVDATGKATANIVAAANASTASFMLRVTNSNGAFAEAPFTVTVVRVTATLSDPLACTGSGNAVAVAVTIGNPNNTPLAANLTTTFTNLIGVPGTCNQPGCTVTATGLSYAATLTPGQTVALNYLTRVADGTAPGAQVCANNTLTFNGGQPLAVTACNTVNCPSPGPGLLASTDAPLNAQRPGSILIYNVFTSNAAAPNQQNTRLSLTNTHPLLKSYVHLFFVDGASCSVADAFVCLTPNQTTSFLASDLDPGTSSYVIAVAVDALGCPSSFNHLIGDEFVKFTSGQAANLGAEAVTAMAGGLPFCDGNSSTAELRFDGLSYSVLPTVLAADNLGSRADGNDTLLILNRVGGNLATGAATLGSVFGILYDDAEAPVSFSFAAGTCQLRSVLSGNSIRTVPRYETFIPAGRTGWLKVSATNLGALTGAVLNFNPNVAVQGGAFNQGHNLHKLTTTNAAVLTIPVFPPGC